MTTTQALLWRQVVSIILTHTLSPGSALLTNTFHSRKEPTYLFCVCSGGQVAAELGEEFAVGMARTMGRLAKGTPKLNEICSWLDEMQHFFLLRCVFDVVAQLRL